MKSFKGLILMSVMTIAMNAHAQKFNLLDAIDKVQSAKETVGAVKDFSGKATEYLNAPSAIAGQKVDCSMHYPAGAPEVVVDKERVERRSFYLCREGYAVQFDPQKKTPLWTSEYLSASLLRGGKEERTDDFRADPAVPYGAQATLNDYKGSKFDRGHVTPAADMNGRNANAMSETFFLTNMVPQVGPNNNRGIWADLEGQIRNWTLAKGRLNVITGPIFSGQYETMGKSKVAIPTHLYKVILDPKTGETIAFVIPNVQIKTAKVKRFDNGNPSYKQTTPEMAIDCGSNCSLGNFVAKVSDVEKYTGLKFFTGIQEPNRTNIVNANPGNFSLSKVR